MYRAIAHDADVTLPKMKREAGFLGGVCCYVESDVLPDKRGCAVVTAK